MTLGKAAFGYNNDGALDWLLFMVLCCVFRGKTKLEVSLDLFEYAMSSDLSRLIDWVIYLSSAPAANIVFSDIKLTFRRWHLSLFLL